MVWNQPDLNGVFIVTNLNSSALPFGNQPADLYQAPYQGYNHLNEAALVEQARRGDETAWTAIVQQHQEPIFRLAYLLLSNSDDAKDIAQEAFIRAFQSLDRFDQSRPLRPWLSRITINLARNRRRSLGRYMAHLTRWFQQESTAIEPSPHEIHLQAWQSQAVWQAIRSLNPSDQEIIYLRYFLELSVTETAEAVDIAPGTVKSRLHRALNRLRTVIEIDFPALIEERLE